MQPHKIHIIGIGGAGMSACALLLKEAGWTVTGSDAECYGPPAETLARAGIHFSLGYAPENIPADAECFMIGRNAKLAPAENEEVRAAIESRKPIYSFPQMLGMITEGRRNIVVAGSYGKSTTTALAAHLLRHAGVDAGYFVGAAPVRTEWLPFPSKLGTAPSFVLEGDEYPSAHDDSQAKFLHLHPQDILLTSVVHDHVNVYPTQEDYEKPFRELLNRISKDGLVVVCADEPDALALASTSGKKVVTYGVENPSADYRAANIRFSERTRFTLLQKGVPLGDIETVLLGAHNVENIVAAAAWALERKLVTFEQIQKAVPEFPGVRRRLDNLAIHSRVPVFEGFGSSYEKARAAIEAVRLHFPEKPLSIVFEPHTFGWRNRANLAWYDDVFFGAKEVFIAAPETQGSATHDQLSLGEILARVGVLGRPYRSADDVVSALSGSEAVLVLTSGSLHGTLPSLAEGIEQKFPL